MLQVSRRADLAVINFKILITISCLSLVTILWEAIEMRFSMVEHNFLLNVSNAVVAIDYLLAGAFFMIWFYTAYKRLYTRSPEMLRVRPVWTVIGFSIPIANLFMPYVLAVKLWRQLRLENGTYPSECRSPGYFKIWWLSHLCVFFGAPAIYLVLIAGMSNGTPEFALFVLSGMGYSLICNSARYAIRLVREINSLQASRV